MCAVFFALSLRLCVAIAVARIYIYLIYNLFLSSFCSFARY